MSRSLSLLSRLIRILAVASCALALPVQSMAEVALARSSSTDAGSIIRIGIIVDDPGPFGQAWQPMHPGTANRRVLNAAGYLNNDGEPSIVRHPTNDMPLVAWAKNSPGGYDVVLSRFENDDWSVPLVLAGGAADELDPFLTISPIDGSVHLVYWIRDGAPRVMHRVAPADLTSWTAPVQISAPGEIAARPSAVFFEGALQVAYEVHDNGFGQTPRRIVVSSQTATGFSPLTVSTSQHAGEQWPRVHSAGGRLWIDWIDAVAAMCWSLQDGPGSWGSLEFEPFASVEEREFHVRGEIRARVMD